MVIADDAMGGDAAPEAIVAGTLAAAPLVGGTILLVGPSERLEALLPAVRPPNLRVVDAPQVIGMDEDPGRAIKAKPDSSLAITVNLVRDGEAEAAVSAGNSGAFMFLAHVRLRPMANVSRPAIAAPLPGRQGPRILLDARANMGSIYAERVFGRTRPKVGLLSIGEESCKGNELTRAAHELLALPDGPVNFVGNIEGDDVLNTDIDVVVADGFAGNVVLKVAEGTAQFILDGVQTESQKSLRTRLGAWLIRPATRRVERYLAHAEYGGALLLGVNGICVVGHGRSNARAICNAILMAERAVAGGVREQLAEGLQRLATAVADAEDSESQTE